MEPPPHKIPKSLPGMRKWLGDLLDFAIRNRILRSETCEIHETPAGTQLLPRTTGGPGGAATNAFPWKVTINDFGTEDGHNWKFIVNKASRLVESSKFDDEVDVDGKATSYSPADDDEGWHSFTVSTEGIKVWIELDLDTTDENWGDILSADIKWEGGGGTWAGGELQYITIGSGDNVEHRQRYLRVLLAIIYDQAGDGTPVVDQWVNSHLELYLSGGDAYDNTGASPEGTILRRARPWG